MRRLDGLGLYVRVCEDWRAGRGEHPRQVFARLAEEVFERNREWERRAWEEKLTAATLHPSNHP